MIPEAPPSSEDRYRAALAHARADDLVPAMALEELGALIDLSGDLRRPEGVQAALQWANRLQGLSLDVTQLALVHYFEANAWETSRILSGRVEDIWTWPHSELEKQIVHLRWALKYGASAELPRYRLCQIHTNLGNLMSHCGRIADALAYWDRAIAIDAAAGMPRGNRALGLERYVRLVHDRGHKAVLLREAYAEINRSLELPLERNAKRALEDAKSRMESHVPEGFFQETPFMWRDKKRRSKQEVAYRRWCLTERLFLNDLNDLGSQPVAAADVLMLPDIVSPLDAGPSLHGLFNQLKQEFVSARYLFYDGMDSNRTHFSDREVRLVNTLDYPSYSLGTEQEKIAFRVAYSLLDKVAFFLNEYLQIGIPQKDVSFRRIWIDGKGSSRRLRSGVQHHRNAPLQGLFWLSKDLYEQERAFTEAIEPDAQQVAAIRHHLEHKYLKIHSMATPRPNNRDAASGMTDTLAYSIGRPDFEAKALRVLRMARNAILYLSLCVHAEEAQRAKNRKASDVIVPIELDDWNDDWKF